MKMSLNIVVVTALALLAVVVVSEAAKLELVNAQQSSTYGDAYADRAIDGDINGWWDGRSCTHSEWEGMPMWQADFAGQRQARVDKVIVSNRVDCCSDRITDVTVFVGDYHRCGSLSYVGGKSQYSVDCGGAVGSSIKITGKANYLTLCEVQAFGTPHCEDKISSTTCQNNKRYCNLTGRAAKSIQGDCRRTCGLCGPSNKCPADYPNVYNNGKHCCATNMEKVYAPYGAQCDGSVIQRDSLCCEGDKHTPCPVGNC